ncbi:cystathionine gamma-synthase [Evansella vedderi]|uniref:Cystathionine gamma-synthase n=1 Tax=Evansella vedderi TaxID=38282 RepID=A0ABU0A248_9BACI|nr:cystathionine gamma-synthase family protein [Evansella vedderi]MDQ0256435.1 cystathionine gamma-synthase [Evansella vedderi]
MREKANFTHLGTKSVWEGEKKQLAHGATQVPTVFSVGYSYNDLDHWLDVALGKEEGHIYGRMTNPTVQAFQDKVKALENAESCTSFSSGMAAISNTLYTFLKPGDRIVTIKDTYGGTNKIFLEFLPNINVDVELCDTTDHEKMEKEVEKGCKILYLETPTNPTLKVVDLKRMIKMAKSVGALVIVDNTFATPINQNPLQLGADLIIHSATKFLGGHADALGGIVCGNEDLVDKIFHYREINGACLDPMSAYLLLRGMKTLELRIERQNENAMKVAKFLESHPKVTNVFYPGLESNEGHEIAKKQMKGFGGMLSFSVKGGMDAVKVFMPQLKHAHKAANLGAVETTVGPPRTTSHVENTPEERKAMGIPEGLVRYSAGIENVEDLIKDLDQALSYIPHQ